MLGLLAFYLAMSAGLVKLKWVERTSSFLLRHMVLMFVPLTVGLMDMGVLLQKAGIGYYRQLGGEPAGRAADDRVIGEMVAASRACFAGIAAGRDG